jgi:hypothetical protein
MGRQLHPSGRQGNTVGTRSLIRQDMKKSCNHLDARATLSGRGLNMETRGARYGKPFVQKTVWMLNAFVRTSPREIRDRLDLGLFSL